MKTLEIRRPDDLHLHFRDGDALGYTVPATANVFRRAIVMPNLVPPVTTVALASEYRDRILEVVPEGRAFEPLMVLYLRDDTSAEELIAAAKSDFVHGVKLYPAGATTNSKSGVTDITALYPQMEVMEAHGLPLLIHGEVTDPSVDVFDREKLFIETHLEKIVRKFTKLKIVFEHITSQAAAEFVASAPDNVAATITPQHLMHNRNDMLVGGIKPHLYCLPILKAQADQAALRKAVASGSPKFFLGTDSAPHATLTKESSCGCAGCYSAPIALPLYATIFEELDILDKLEAFASLHGPRFYGLEVSEERVVLERGPLTVPDRLDYVSEDGVVPLGAGMTLPWRMKTES